MNISLRKFPYPFKAAFSICCDCDDIASLDTFLVVMDYFNCNTITELGKGLGLEVGNSFWFFNESTSNQLSYFKSFSKVETSFAPICRELCKSGHLDIMHTFGNFDNNSFSRKFAEIAINELIKHDLKIQTWVNHGGNSQNVGYLNNCLGSIPGTSEYHIDLCREYGLRYFCTMFLTHIIGQDALPTFNVQFMNILQKILMKTKYRRFKFPIFDLKNRLMVKTILQDGNNIWDFQRFINSWGGKKEHNLYDLCFQIKSQNINRLLKNEGFLILYTHIFDGLSSIEEFPLLVKKNMQYIAYLNKCGKLLVCTTTRLLKYNEIIKNLQYKIIKQKDEIKILINETINTLNEKYHIYPSDLNGLTFYCDYPEKVSIFLGNRIQHTQINTKDRLGKRSVSIPWLPLEYPH